MLVGTRRRYEGSRITTHHAHDYPQEEQGVDLDEELVVRVEILTASPRRHEARARLVVVAHHVVLLGRFVISRRVDRVRREEADGPADDGSSHDDHDQRPQKGHLIVLIECAVADGVAHIGRVV